MTNDMENLIVEVNQIISFQRGKQKLQYKPENLFIKQIAIGIREEESDWIAYMTCKVWDIGSQKDVMFWNYATQVEQETEKKPFLAICKYIKLKNNTKKSFWHNSYMNGWVIHLSEFHVYEDAMQNGLDYKQLHKEILLAIPTILQHSFFLKPSYIFIDILQTQIEQIQILESAGFQQIGTIQPEGVQLFLKSYK